MLSKKIRGNLRKHYSPPCGVLLLAAHVFSATNNTYYLVRYSFDCNPTYAFKAKKVRDVDFDVSQIEEFD